MDNFDESDEKFMIEINLLPDIMHSASFILHDTQRDSNEALENLFLNHNTKLLLQAKNPYSKLAFIKSLKDNLICLGYLHESIDTLNNYFQEDIINNSSITSNFMPKKRKNLTRKRSHDKTNISGQNETMVYSYKREHSQNDQVGSTTTTTAYVTRILSPSNSQRSLKHRSEDDGDYEDEEMSMRNYLNKKSKSDMATAYGGYSSPSSFKTPKGTGSSQANLKSRDATTTDFYSFESTHESGESSYHTANEHEESRPIFLKHLENVSVIGK
jgi:hypothetical protein